MMKKLKFYIAMFMITAFFAGCGDEPIFTEMAGNRLKVVIKGTLESEGGSNFESMPGDAVTMRDDSVVVVPSSENANIPPETFMFDIAELRLGGKKFANYRQVFKFDLDDAADEPFFDGRGVILKNDDPPEGRYDTVQVYIRKMVFDNARVYTPGSGFTSEEAEVIFHEKTVNGFDFNQLMVNSYWDSLRLEAADILRVFPLEVPIIGGLDYSRYDPETVLEIRFVIKNFIKKYEYPFYSEGLFKVSHYYALSDWLRDVRAGEDDIGRNIHAVARAYVPGKTGTVTVSGLSNNEYVIMIPDSEDVTHYKISEEGSALRTNIVGNYDFPLPPKYPGNYIEAVLDYYLNLERYKYLLREDVMSGLDFDGYQAAWDNYEASVKNFKIAPFVANSKLTGSVQFNNVPPGSYKVYRAGVIALPYGNLFQNDSGHFSEERTVVVNIGDPPASVSF